MRILRWSNETLLSGMLAAGLLGYIIGSMFP
jgi:hypothetical protein